MKSRVIAAPALLAWTLSGCGDGAPSGPDAGNGGAWSTSSSSSVSPPGPSTGGSAAGPFANSASTGEPGEGWAAVPWVDPAEGCNVRYALEPGRYMPKLTWEPCPFGEPGCERLVKSWEARSETGLTAPLVARVDEGYWIGFGIVRPDYEQWAVTWRPDGEVESIIAAPQYCYVREPVPTPGGQWHMVRLRSGAATVVFQPYGAGPEAALVQPWPIDPRDPRGRVDLLAGTLSSSSDVVLHDWVTDAFHRLGRSGKTRWVGDGAALMLAVPSFNRPEAMLWTRASASFTPLVEAGATVVTDVQADADATLLAWVTAPEPPDGSGEWGRGELFTSPWATSRAELVPRSLGEVPATGPAPRSAMGAGLYVAYSAYEDVITAVRLTDGHRWTVPVPRDETGALMNDLTYVDETYFFSKSSTAIYRHRLEAIGPGVPGP